MSEGVSDNRHLETLNTRLSTLDSRHSARHMTLDSNVTRTRRKLDLELDLTACAELARDHAFNCSTVHALTHKLTHSLSHSLPLSLSASLTTHKVQRSTRTHGLTYLRTLRRFVFFVGAFAVSFLSFFCVVWVIFPCFTARLLPSFLRSFVPSFLRSFLRSFVPFFRLFRWSLPC